MRRLCVFYNKPKYKATGGRVEWFVCKECMAQIVRGQRLPMMKRVVKEMNRNFND